MGVENCSRPPGPRGAGGGGLGDQEDVHARWRPMKRISASAPLWTNWQVMQRRMVDLPPPAPAEIRTCGESWSRSTEREGGLPGASPWIDRGGGESKRVLGKQAGSTGSRLLRIRWTRPTHDGCRATGHPRCSGGIFAVRLRRAFPGPTALGTGVLRLGDPIATLPAVYHQLWHALLTMARGRPLNEEALVTTSPTGRHREGNDEAGGRTSSRPVTGSGSRTGSMSWSASTGLAAGCSLGRRPADHHTHDLAIPRALAAPMVCGVVHLCP